MMGSEDNQNYSPPTEDVTIGEIPEGYDIYASEETSPEEPNTEQSTSSQELEENLQKRIRKKKISSDRRFDQLIYERGLLEQQNVYKDSIISEQNKKLEEFKNQLQHKDKISNDYFETALQERESSLVREIKRAKEEGDIDAEIKLIEEMADIKAKKNTNSLLQFQRQEQEAQNYNNIREEEYTPLETTIPSNTSSVPQEFQEWLEDNSWYNNSPRLRQEADTIARDLSDRLAFNNQDHLIGTPEFFQSVSNIMNDNYGLGQNRQNVQSRDRDFEEEREPMEEMNYSNVNSVAPVSKRGIGMSDLQNRNFQNGRNIVGPLSKEEYSIARHLPQRGMGESEIDLIKRYEKAKKYPRSNEPGGSPHRLTIY
jgi:hypothetical protein